MIRSPQLLEAPMTTTLSPLLERLTGDALDPLANQLDADRSTTRNAVAVALPMILNGLARNASAPEGASSLRRALERDHDGALLDDAEGFLRSPDLEDGNGILGHVFGDRRAAVERGVAKASGLDIGKVGQLLAMVAPLVLGALGRQQRERGLDEGGLRDLLDGERRAAEDAVPGLGGLGALLDRDSDGQITDDLANLGKSLLGGLLGDKR
ncbi:MAG: DUF937 domain-containing protein [Gemmatimonadota bacterium]